MSNIDSVEVAVETLRYLLDLVEFTLTEVDDANAHMARVSVDDPSAVDELVDARASILCASDHVARLHGALGVLVPEDES